MNIFIILVRYDPSIDCSWLYDLFDRSQVFEFWTSEALLSTENINDAFEFSAYQYGLNQLCRNFISTDMVSIIFMNDTAFSSHLRPFARFLASRLSGISFDDGTCRVIGLASSLNDGVEDVSIFGLEYISTWMFLLTGEVQALRSFSFFDGGLLSRHKAGLLFDDLPRWYVQRVLLWLNPKDLFRGWYKSLPRKTLQKREFERKKLTIFLEHTLPTRNPNVLFVDLSKSLIISDRYTLKMFRILDRGRNFLVKVSYRVRFLFGAS